MSNTKTGGPAFPGLHPSAECRYQDEGMTLRDYFAAKAMQGLISDSNAVDEGSGDKLSIPDHAELIAAASYAMADAMLKAREA